MHWKILLSILSLASLTFFSSCDTKGGENGEELAIRKKSQSYVEAFNNKDYKALGSLWAEDAKYVNPRTDQVLKSREEIEGDYRSLFEKPGEAKLEVDITKIVFPQTDQAIETGVAVVMRPGEELDRTAYKAKYEKRNGKWLLTEVREVDIAFPSTNHENLKELDWLVGHWIDEDEDSKIESTCEWDRYKNFLTQHFTVTVEGQLELEGRQVIAWDAANEKIRSWVFDSDGGFGEGTWKKEADKWIVETSFTLADGRRGSSINVYTPLNKDTYTWESTGREVGGELLPNIEEVKVHKV